MVENINKRIEIIKEDELNLPDGIRKKIEVFWKEQVKENPHLFNGEIWSVADFKELQDKIVFTLKRTDYAHYLYDERVGLEGKNGCYNFNGGILLETKDGYYVLGEMSGITSYPRGLQICGGNLDEKDINSNGEVNWLNNISRELKEEVNIELFGDDITKYQIKYLEKPEGRRHAYTLLMKGMLALTSSQMKEHYKNYKEQLEQNGEEVEFERLHFIKVRNALEELNKLSNPKRPYLKGLLDLDSRERNEVER